MQELVQEIFNYFLNDLKLVSTTKQSCDCIKNFKVKNIFEYLNSVTFQRRHQIFPQGTLGYVCGQTLRHFQPDNMEDSTLQLVTLNESDVPGAKLIKPASECSVIK